MMRRICAILCLLLFVPLCGCVSSPAKDEEPAYAGFVFEDYADSAQAPAAVESEPSLLGAQVGGEQGTETEPASTYPPHNETSTVETDGPTDETQLDDPSAGTVSLPETPADNPTAGEGEPYICGLLPAPSPAASATPEAYQRMVRVDGTLFVESKDETPEGPWCGTLDGEIDSSTTDGGTPQVDGQSNFGTGYGYIYAGDGWLLVEMGEDGYTAFRAVDETP